MAATDDPPTLEALARQLDGLERANRWWRRAAGLAALGLAAILLSGQAAPPARSLEVEQLLLRDAAGRVRVALRVLDNDAIVLTFRDRLERDRLLLGLLPDGLPLLSLYDEHRRRRAALGMLDADAPALALYGSDGTSRLRLALDQGNTPRFLGVSAEGSVVWEQPAGAALP